MMKKTSQSDVLETTIYDKQIKGHGKNFKSLIAAGSWTISGFHYGRSKCACCGRPIRRILQLKNESHHSTSAYSETIEIGVVCGPKVFIESCVGFYSDPEKEWERQHQVWKDYINYVILCVKHEKLWKMVPEGLRTKVDEFLQDGYKAQKHSGGWWMVRDAKKHFLKLQRNPDVLPSPLAMASSSRMLLTAMKRQKLIPESYDMIAQWSTDQTSLNRTIELQLFDCPQHPSYSVVKA